MLLLDAEIALKEAENNLRQSKEELQTRFRLSEEEALLLLDQFLAARPPALLSKAIETLKSVQAGSVLAEIVPEEQGLTIRANLRPENVADVYLGQEARISLSAYDVSRYGSLAGVVKNVASNTTEREGQPPFYETIITVPDPVFTKTGQSAEIIPGMTVVVDIIGGKRTVLDYILTPINKATSVAFREN